MTTMINDVAAASGPRIDYAKVKCPTAEAILETCVILAVNEAYSDGDLDDTVKACERVVGYLQSKR